MAKNKSSALIFEYKNWRGETGVRRVLPIKLWYGKTEYHPQGGWLLKAKDLDKNAERDFAVNDIIKFLQEAPR